MTSNVRNRWMRYSFPEINALAVDDELSLCEI
jgi:hypothetical protein